MNQDVIKGVGRLTTVKALVISLVAVRRRHSCFLFFWVVVFVALSVFDIAIFL